MDALPKRTPNDTGMATRLWSQGCLNALANVLPELVGGSADLALSHMTLVKRSGDFLKVSYAGRYFRFGIRVVGRGAVCNAISVHMTGLVPSCATFANFGD